MSEPVVKEPRTLQTAQTELAVACQQIGYLQFQLEIELPKEIQKRFNEVISLQKEINKLTKIQEDAQQEEIDKMKASMNGKHNVVDLTPKTTHEPETTSVQ